MEAPKEKGQGGWGVGTETENGGNSGGDPGLHDGDDPGLHDGDDPGLHDGDDPTGHLINANLGLLGPG